MSENMGNFGGHRRKIMPLDPAGGVWEAHELHRLEREARDKAARLNQHVLGYGELAEREWQEAGIAAPDMTRLRQYRLERIRRELKQRDYAAAVLYDPINIRYSCDATNMQVWVSHNATRYCFVPAEGPVTLFDYHHCEHLSDHAGIAGEVRPAISYIFFYGGTMIEDRIRRWANDIEELVDTHGSGNRRVAFDLLQPRAAAELARRNISVHDGQEVMERAREIKNADELLAMRRAIHSCERAMAEMEQALKPGMSENELWAILHKGNIERGGEWIETRLLSSGPRTNPWFQESSSRIIEAGDMVAFDTDLIGPYGYCSDISRSWICGEGKATNEQRDLYQIAHEQILANTALLAPGKSFRELSETAKTAPPDCMPNRYGSLWHGVGMCDEYPAIPHPVDVTPDKPLDDVLHPGMVVCVESYVGRLGGHEGVKLEDQVLITETGAETLSPYPFDERLMA